MFNHEFIANVYANIISSFLWVLIGLGYAWYKKNQYDKIYSIVFRDLEINQVGWNEYLRGYGDLYEKLLAKQGSNVDLKWNISNAIGSLKLVRTTKDDLIKNWLTRILYNNKIAELEAIESSIINYLNVKTPQIQNSNL